MLNDPESSDEPGRCDAVSDDGLPCQKRLVGDLRYHGGGHVFASDETWARMNKEHFDAAAALAGLPFSTHKPDDCPGPPECWRGAGRW